MPATENPPSQTQRLQAVEEARAFSRFLDRMLQARSWLAEELVAGLDLPLDAAAMQQWLDARRASLPAEEAEAALMAALRDLRCRVLCHILVRDLAGRAPLAEVMESMTALAEVAVRAAREFAWQQLTERYGEPHNAAGERQEMLIVGMGKLGGRELNVSSDIDLIFLYPEEGETAGGRRTLSNFEFFTRLGQRLIRILNEATEHGQVFRVDMRLRPYGESGPLVCSLGALEEYFITQGREWERYAWIKGRVIDGAEEAELHAIVRPFVFRKYLDFGAIGAMNDLHAQIRREVARHDRMNNIKLGPGGIREIEFIAQVFQLIRAGRVPALQVRPTLQVLAQLGERALLAADAVTELHEDYDFLRRLEHRLQYREDAQTHDLPEASDELARLAQTMGFDSAQTFREQLDACRARVSARFDAVFHGGEKSPDAPDGESENQWQENEDAEAARARLESLGYHDAEATFGRIAAWRGSAAYQHMSASAKEKIDALLPRTIEAAGKTKAPDDTLPRALTLFEAISRRSAYLSLLQQYPQALTRVVELMAASSHGAQFLTQHPILLDELLDDRNLYAEPDWQQFSAELAAELDALEPDTEQQMDRMRERCHAMAFRLLMQDISGQLSVERLADHLSLLADLTLSHSMARVWQRLTKKHCDTPRFAAIGYGKLGGKELGYGADLDLVFLFEDDAAEAFDTYTRYARRINTWLSSRTAAGVLYETDLRLRPDGDSGLIVSSLAGFRKYQLEQAWVWEHQALTRARFCAGSPALAAGFEAIRREILSLPRDLAQLREDILAMRQKMYDNHPAAPGLFDLKHSHGGLIDVEFVIQYLVLGHTREHLRLAENLGNIALLGIAAELGLIDTTLAADCAQSYRTLRHMQHVCRLNGKNAQVPEAQVQTLTAPVRALWQQIFG